MKTGPDQREAKRVVFFTMVLCGESPLNLRPLRTRDLSPTGVFIETAECPPAGTVLALKMFVRGRTIAVNGEVRHARPGEGMGVLFLDLKAEDRVAIEQAIVVRATGAAL